jgi:hypothetical protein
MKTGSSIAINTFSMFGQQTFAFARHDCLRRHLKHCRTHSQSFIHVGISRDLAMAQGPIWCIEDMFVSGSKANGDSDR